MLMIPIETVGHTDDALIIVLDQDGLDRMAKADPAEVILRQCGKTLLNPTVLLCFEKPSPDFNRAVQSGNLKAIIEFLQRGWKFQPDRGDHDRGPESLGRLN